MLHVDEARLHAYLDGETEWSGEDRSVVERHLAGCAACQTRLEKVQRLRQRGREILGGGPSRVEQPSFHEVQERARAARPRPWSSVVARWSWAASVLLALAGGWLGRAALSDSSGPERTALDQGSVPAPSTREAEPAAELAADASVRPDATRPGPLAAAGRQTGGGVAPDRALGAKAPLPDRWETAPTKAEGDARTSGEAEPEPAAAPAAPLPAALARTGAVPSPANESRVSTVAGRVTDERGRGVAGAQVRVVETGRGVVTGVDGTYSLPVGAMQTETAESIRIQATALGYASAERHVNLQGATARAADIVMPPVALPPSALAEAEIPAAAQPDARAAQNRTRSPEHAPVDAAGWARVDLSRAGSHLGHAVRVLPDLDVLSVEIGRESGAPAVRVRQALGPGSVLTLVQQRLPTRRPQLAPAAPPPSAPAGQAVAVREINGLRVRAHGPLPADSLRALLLRLR